MEALRRVKPPGFQMVISELEVSKWATCTVRCATWKTERHARVSSGEILTRQTSTACNKQLVALDGLLSRKLTTDALSTMPIEQLPRVPHRDDDS